METFTVVLMGVIGLHCTHTHRPKPTHTHTILYALSLGTKKRERASLNIDLYLMMPLRRNERVEHLRDGQMRGAAF